LTGGPWAAAGRERPLWGRRPGPAGQRWSPSRLRPPTADRPPLPAFTGGPRTPLDARRSRRRGVL